MALSETCGAMSVLATDPQGRTRILRIPYEMCVLQALRDQLRCKELWVVGADRYRNPDDDVPSDFAIQRPAYYAALKLPSQAEDFMRQLQQTMRDELAALDRTLPQQCRRRRFSRRARGGLSSPR